MPPATEPSLRREVLTRGVRPAHAWAASSPSRCGVRGDRKTTPSEVVGTGGKALGGRERERSSGPFLRPRANVTAPSRAGVRAYHGLLARGHRDCDIGGGPGCHRLRGFV